MLRRDTDSLIRYVVVAGLLLSSVIRLLVAEEYSLSSLACELCASCGVLLLPSYSKRSLLLMSAIIVALLSVLFSLLYSLFPKAVQWRDFSYSLLLIVPALTHRVIYVLKYADNLEFLTKKVAGWQFLINNSKELYSIFLLSLFIIKLSLPPYLACDIISILLIGLVTVMNFVKTHFAKNSDNEEFKRTLMKKVSKSTDLDIKVDAVDIGIKYRLIFTRMTEYMKTKRPYLSPKFSIEEMAKEMLTNRNYVSKVINECTKKNFSHYINEYRVVHAVAMFKANNHLKVKDLAQISGFSSPVTFNMAFKLVMNSTPSEWCAAYRKSVMEEKEQARKTGAGR